MTEVRSEKGPEERSDRAIELLTAKLTAGTGLAKSAIEGLVRVAGEAQALLDRKEGSLDDVWQQLEEAEVNASSAAIALTDLLEATFSVARNREEQEPHNPGASDQS